MVYEIRKTDDTTNMGREMLIRVSAPHFVAGVVVGSHAAPIVQYMARWPMQKILAYCTSKGWNAEIVAEVSDGSKSGNISQ
jgi:hypothetical protein